MIRVLENVVQQGRLPGTQETRENSHGNSVVVGRVTHGGWIFLFFLFTCPLLSSSKNEEMLGFVAVGSLGLGSGSCVRLGHRRESRVPSSLIARVKKCQ